MRNRFTDAYGLDVPFVAAPLGSLSGPRLVAAVCEAGGLGTLGAVGAPLTSPTGLRAQIFDIRSRTVRPFGVNFITPLATEKHIDVCIAERVPVVSFHLGDPPELFIGRLRDAGVRVWMQ